MFMIPNAFAFFDIGNTLASVRVSAAGDRIEELIVFDDVPPALEQLRAEGVRLGILSNRGTIPEKNVNEALEKANLMQFFERELILYGRKDSSLLFEQAAAQVRRIAGENNQKNPLLLFVGEDASEREWAQKADFLVAPHPKLALNVLRREAPLRFLRIRIPSRFAETDWRGTLRNQELVPLHLSARRESPESVVYSVYAIADASTATKLDDFGFWVDRLGEDDAPLTNDLFILRDDRQIDSGFLAPEGNSFTFFGEAGAARKILASTHEGLFVAIPANRSLESFHFSGSLHGHNLKLIPSMTLLESAEADENERLSEAPALFETTPLALDETAILPTLSNTEKNILKKNISTTSIKRDVKRYTGGSTVLGSTLITSRHIHHIGNANAVTVLTNDLTQIGNGSFTVRTHQFTHAAGTYRNVEATLPSAGLSGIVLITAHLDSTGARQAGYRSSIDAAPGADDDASGIAGVLSAARALLKLSETNGTRRREIRFVLFNAEEQGLIGSRAYARAQAAIGAKIAAVFQMDMVGFDVNPARLFELHYGFTPSTTVQTRSAKLATLISQMIPQVSATLPPPQLYPGTNGSGDPAESRSDHYSFQAEGYAACLASEDFFVGPGPSAPAPEPNPNYHLPADNTVNAAYAADIARVVAAAAWVAATR